LAETSLTWVGVSFGCVPFLQKYEHLFIVQRVAPRADNGEKLVIGSQALKLFLQIARTDIGEGTVCSKIIESLLLFADNLPIHSRLFRHVAFAPEPMPWARGISRTFPGARELGCNQDLRPARGALV
jgi:hypothetical protein